MRTTTALSPTTSIAPRRCVDLRPGLLIDVAHGGRTTTIRLVGALDLATAHRLTDMVAAGSLDDARFVTLDLAGLGHVDVTGWHAIRDVTRHLVDAGVRVTQVGSRATYDRLDRVLSRADWCRRSARTGSRAA
jgi:anti-anti-sigma regulatory factor